MSDVTLPDPLVPADVDISGLDGFMLNVQRLFASELWALSTGDEFKAAMGLWGRAWQQSPPGSLPDDDRVLGAFSGAGAKWKKVRDIALRGFVKCSDGRLYHTVLCEDVINAAKKREAFRDRTKAATEAKKLAKQEHERRQEWLKDLQHRERDEERNDVGNGKRNDVQNEPSQRNVTTDVTSVQGQGQGQGQGQRREDKTPPAFTATAPGDGRAGDFSPDAQQAVVDFERIREEVFPKDSSLTAPRLTLWRQAQQWIEAGFDVTSLAESVLDGMHWYADRGKGAPSSFDAMKKSLADKSAKRRETAIAETQVRTGHRDAASWPAWAEDYRFRDKFWNDMRGEFPGSMPPEWVAYALGRSDARPDGKTDKPGNGGKVKGSAPSASPDPERLRENSPGKAPIPAAGDASAWHAALDMWLQSGIFLQSRPGKPFGQVGCECPLEILVERLGSNWEEEIAATIAARSRVGAA